MKVAANGSTVSACDTTRAMAPLGRKAMASRMGASTSRVTVSTVARGAIFRRAATW